MKKVIYIFIALFLLSCGSNKTASISTDTTAEISSPAVTVQSILSNMENQSYREGEVLVKFKPGVSASASIMTHQAAGASVTKTFNLVPDLEHVKIPRNVSVSDAIVQYMSDPNVEYAEPNYIIHAFSTIPNDTYFVQQWALNNTGLYANGTPGADIQASDAWDITRGSGSIIIAVADTGIDYNHPELVGNIWNNALETICTDGIDNDMNGYIDDCTGWDFANIDNDPIDDNGHGTHVAGTIGAVGNNGDGVSGVMWKAQLMALKFLGSDGLGTIVDAILAIEYAVANGARIINASYGSSTFSQSEYDAINSANSAGVLLVAAAGNAGANNDLTPAYPASHNLPNIISVAATDQNDSRATFSNFGPVSVDVAAPGAYILNTVPPGLTFSLCTGTFNAGYDLCSGTSMSAPHVSGLAGLLYSYYTGFSYSQVRSTILRYVDVLPELTGWILTNGRVNAYKALSSLLPPTGLTAAFSSSISLSWTDNATGEDGYKIERNVSGGGYVQIAAIGPDNTTYTDPDVNSTTTYSYRVRANNTIPADSAYSNEAVVPIAPTNLSASAVSENQINLSWFDNSNNETGFRIERKDDISGTYAEIATVGAGVTTYSNIALNRAKTYFYRVLAHTATGSSAYSNEASAKTLGSSRSGGGNCSIGARQNTPTAMANITVLLLPLVFMAIIRLKRRYRGQKV